MKTSRLLYLVRKFNRPEMQVLAPLAALVMVSCAAATPAVGKPGAEMPVSQPTTEAALKNGDLIPDLTLQTLDGGTVQMSQFQGSVVVLYFWSTQISPALGISQANAAAKNFGDEGLVVLGIDSFGETEDTVHTYADEFDLKFTIILDSDQTVSKLFAARPGMTVWIHPDGTIRSIIPNFTSATLSQEDISNRLKNYLSKP